MILSKMSNAEVISFAIITAKFFSGNFKLAKRSPQAKNRQRSHSEERIISSKRQIIETAFSCITSLFPRFIKTRTENGFLIKVFCFILAYSASFLWQGSLT